MTRRSRVLETRLITLNPDEPEHLTRLTELNATYSSWDGLLEGTAYAFDPSTTPEIFSPMFMGRIRDAINAELGTDSGFRLHLVQHRFDFADAVNGKPESEDQARLSNTWMPFGILCSFERDGVRYGGPVMFSFGEDILLNQGEPMGEGAFRQVPFEERRRMVADLVEAVRDVKACDVWEYAADGCAPSWPESQDPYFPGGIVARMPRSRVRGEGATMRAFEEFLGMRLIHEGHEASWHCSFGVDPAVGDDPSFHSAMDAIGGTWSSAYRFLTEHQKEYDRASREAHGEDTSLTWQHDGRLRAEDATNRMVWAMQ